MTVDMTAFLIHSDYQQYPDSYNRFRIVPSLLTLNKLHYPRTTLSPDKCPGGALEIGPVVGERIHESRHADLVAVGDEDLAERAAGDHRKQVADPCHVELVEHIVEKEGRGKAVGLLHDPVLRKLKRHQERLLLPLRAAAPYRIAVHPEHEIVPMHP